MTTRFQVTITQTTGGQEGGSRHSECIEIVDLLERLQQVFGTTGPNTTTGTITDRNNNGRLTYTYTPTAGS